MVGGKTYLCKAYFNENMDRTNTGKVARLHT